MDIRDRGNKVRGTRGLLGVSFKVTSELRHAD